LTTNNTINVKKFWAQHANQGETRVKRLEKLCIRKKGIVQGNLDGGRKKRALGSSLLKH